MNLFRIISCEKLTNELTFRALKLPMAVERVVSMANMPRLSDLTEAKTKFMRFSKQKIVTCGNKDFLGFFNTKHVDRNDGFCSKKFQNKIQTFLESSGKKLKDLKTEKTEEQMIKAIQKAINETDYLLKWMDMHYIGTSTTCVYQFVGTDELGEEDPVAKLDLQLEVGPQPALPSKRLNTCQEGVRVSHRGTITSSICAHVHVSAS